MKRKNFSAYTPPGANYPPYISINSDFPDTGLVEFTVRSPPDSAGNCGLTAEIRMDRAEALRVLEDAIKAIRAASESTAEE